MNNGHIQLCLIFQICSSRLFSPYHIKRHAPGMGMGLSVVTEWFAKHCKAMNQQWKAAVALVFDPSDHWLKPGAWWSCTAPWGWSGQVWGGTAHTMLQASSQSLWTEPPYFSIYHSIQQQQVLSAGSGRRHMYFFKFISFFYVGEIWKILSLDLCVCLCLCASEKPRWLYLLFSLKSNIRL